MFPPGAILPVSCGYYRPILNKARLSISEYSPWTEWTLFWENFFRPPPKNSGGFEHHLCPGFLQDALDALASRRGRESDPRYRSLV